jgi:hypothetical protein
VGTGEDAVETRGSERRGIVIGAGCGLVGLSPWLVLGERLPLQNLWRTQTMPGAMPWAMVPLNQYYLPTILALLIVPGLIGGVVVRALRRPELRMPAGQGLLVFQVVAVVQSFAVLVPGLRLSGLAAVYVVGLAVSCLLGLGIGQAVLWLIPSDRPADTALGLILAAAPLARWLIAPWELGLAPFGVPSALVVAVQWLPGLMVGLVLVGCTLRRQNRLRTWVVGALVVWLVPAAFDAASSAVARNTARDGLGAVADRAFELIRVFAGPGSSSLSGALLALGVGVAGSLGVWLVRKVRSPAQVEQR